MFSDYTFPRDHKTTLRGQIECVYTDNLLLAAVDNTYPSSSRIYNIVLVYIRIARAAVSIVLPLVRLEIRIFSSCGSGNIAFIYYYYNIINNTKLYRFECYHIFSFITFTSLFDQRSS